MNVMKNQAIITGASSGLGATYARVLAQKGWDLLLTGRRKKRLLELKKELETKYNTKINFMVVDFTKPYELNNLLKTISQMDVIDLLINNAGFGYRKDFFKSDFRVQQNMLEVHITAATRIVYEVVPKMVVNKKGAIINVASLSAFVPAPLSYFYCSSKAFLVSFSECLHVDLLHTGIKVQALCPGFTKTEFHFGLKEEEKTSWMNNKLFWMSADKVVDYSLKALCHKKVICIPGFINQFIYCVVRAIPKSIFYRLMARGIDKTPHMVSLTI